MGNPTGDQVKAAIEGLRTDASTWSTMSLQLTGAHGVAQRLTLGTFEFSGLAHAAGTDETYEQIRQKMADLLDQASLTFDAIGDAIRKAADDYERDEDNTVHRMQNVY
ncbi:hypothetical protein [Actinoplanes sp. N902-109]|uniref:hypothetical protein n=1 Tax=Actinoplanes sp. (strain N902-109) TaxID=649831 RepID=UPI0003293E87|nr:hypothetical protein [Actinoplanes sp. N902-109]AGL19149.1 hypothetical protein L083_5639 [Actinoplanes sp. N902-109]